jgi:hypothetical protein
MTKQWFDWLERVSELTFLKFENDMDEFDEDGLYVVSANYKTLNNFDYFMLPFGESSTQGQYFLVPTSDYNRVRKNVKINHEYVVVGASIPVEDYTQTREKTYHIGAGEFEKECVEYVDEDGEILDDEHVYFIDPKFERALVDEKYKRKLKELKC